MAPIKYPAKLPLIQPPPPKPVPPKAPVPSSLRPLFPDQMSATPSQTLSAFTGFRLFGLNLGALPGLRPALPPAPPATAPRALDPAAVAQANADYDRYKSDGSYVGHDFLDLMKQHAGEPDYLAQLVSRAKDPRDAVLDSMIGGLNTAFVKGPDGSYSNWFDDSDRQAILDTVKAGLDAGTITPQEIRDRAAMSMGWAEVAQRLSVASAGITPQATAVAADLGQVKGEYDAAHQDVLAKEGQLTNQLSAFGAALTDAQRAKYIQSFRDDPANVAAYQREAAAAKSLADCLQTNQAALLDAATRDSEARSALYESLKSLSASGQGKTALDFAVAIQRDPSSPLGQAFAASFPNFDDEITAPAMSAAATQLMVENGGNAEQALALIKAEVDPLKAVWAGKAGTDQIQEAWQAIDLASQGQYDGLATLAQDWDGSSGPLRALAGLGVVFGAAGAVTEAAQGDYLNALKSFSQSGQQGLELLVGATKSLADAGKLAQFGEDGLRFASFAQRLAPGLGLVANATSFILDGQQATADGGNAGYAVAALGDALGVMGSALELFPLTAPAGALVNGIGAVVTAVGTVLAGFVDDGALNDEKLRLLAAAGIGEPLSTALISANPDQIQQLKNLGFTIDQIQALATNDPQLVQSPYGLGPSLEGLANVKDRLGLSTDQLFGMMQAAGDGSRYLFDAFSRPLDFMEINNADSVAELVTGFQNLATGTDNEEQALALQRASAYLQGQPLPTAVPSGGAGGSY